VERDLSLDSLTVDLDDLTIEEVEQVEDITGVPIDELAQQSGRPKGRMLRALAFVVLRRDDPSVTLEDVGKLRLKLGAPDPKGLTG